MFALVYYDMGTYFYMSEQQQKKYHIFLLVRPIYIKFSLFYYKCFSLSIEFI